MYQNLEKEHFYTRYMYYSNVVNYFVSRNQNKKFVHCRTVLYGK